MLRILLDLLTQRQLLASRLFNDGNFHRAFAKDLLRAKKRVIIESPYLTERRVRYYVPIFKKLSKRKVKIRINTRHPRYHDEAMRIQADKAAKILLASGVKIYTYVDRRHWKLAAIDRVVLWEGSMNILSHGSSGEIMRRTKSYFFCHKMLDFSGSYN